MENFIKNLEINISKIRENTHEGLSGGLEVWTLNLSEKIYEKIKTEVVNYIKNSNPNKNDLNKLKKWLFSNKPIKCSLYKKEGEITSMVKAHNDLKNKLMIVWSITEGISNQKYKRSKKENISIIISAIAATISLVGVIFTIIINYNTIQSIYKVEKESESIIDQNQ